MTELKSSDICRETLPCPHCGKLIEIVSQEVVNTTATINKVDP